MVSQKRSLPQLAQPLQFQDFQLPTAGHYATESVRL